MKLTLKNKPASAYEPDIPPKSDSKENTESYSAFVYQGTNTGI